MAFHGDLISIVISDFVILAKVYNYENSEVLDSSVAALPIPPEVDAISSYARSFLNFY